MAFLCSCLCIEQLLCDYFIRSATQSLSSSFLFFSLLLLKVCNLSCHSTSDIIIRDSYQNHFVRLFFTFMFTKQEKEEKNAKIRENVMETMPLNLGGALFLLCRAHNIRAFGLITQNLIMSKIGSKSLTYWCTHHSGPTFVSVTFATDLFSFFYCISGK